jgi:hypothetical protein
LIFGENGKKASEKKMGKKIKKGEEEKDVDCVGQRGQPGNFAGYSLS